MNLTQQARSFATAPLPDADLPSEQRPPASAAIVWILAALVAGLLVSEFSALGSEPQLTPTPNERSQTLADRLQFQETEFALLHANLDALERVHDVTDRFRQRRQQPEQSALSSDKLTRQAIAVDSLDANSSGEGTELALFESRPGETSPIGLVSHGVRSMLTPVHVRPVEESEPIADVPPSNSAVAFVDEDTQTEGLVSARVEEAAEASLLRSRPQLRQVTAPARRVPNQIVNEMAAQPSDILTTARDQPAAAGDQFTEQSVPASRNPVSQSLDARRSYNFPTISAATARRAAPNTVNTAAPIAGTAPFAEQPTLAAPATAATPGPIAQSNTVTQSNTVAQQPETPTDPQRVASSWPFNLVNVQSNGSGVQLNVNNADVRSVFEMLARGYQMNILVAPDVQGTITANIDGLSPEQTLRGVVKMAGLSMQRDGDLIYIYPSDRLPLDARQLRVFALDFARASTLEPTIQGLLSPVGNAYASTINDQDTLQTQESIVVVDIPEVIAQVENYIYQADIAPRQVLIEARVLEVELSDDMVHGVDFSYLFSGDVELGIRGLAEPVVTTANPRGFVRVSGADLAGVLEFLETTTDSKTLASPRVQVVNGQNAKIQVGQQLGFTVATVTQTATIQDVQFLETGVVLNVTPTISRDNRILLQVKPEVSDGEINPTTLLPEEETREVETSVLLDDHEGVIIGGLIQEKDRTVIKKLPWLGDVRYVGKLFRRREAIRSRSEIIVALIPHIVDTSSPGEREIMNFEQADTPLFHGPLQRNCRPWEPRLPDPSGDELLHMDVNTVNRRLP